MLRSLTLILLLLLAACDLMPKRLEDTSKWGAQEFYEKGKEQLTNGDYEGAIQTFESLEARFPYGRYAQQAQLETAYAYYKDEESAAAISAADRFIKLHPNHKNVDYAYYLKGLANFNDNLGILSTLVQGILKQDMSERDSKASRESFESFRELINRFPHSQYVSDSKKRMAHLLTVLAKGEVYVARYYMKREAYVAAVNRAQFAVKEYPRTPSTEEALSIMVEAYDALGMVELRNDTERVLAQNFPDSPYLSGYTTVAANNASWWKFW